MTSIKLELLAFRVFTPSSKYFIEADSQEYHFINFLYSLNQVNDFIEKYNWTTGIGSVLSHSSIQKLMIKHLLFLLVFTSFFVVNAQDQPNLISPTEVTMITYWEMGDQFNYSRTEEKYRFINGKRKTKYDELITNNVVITVLDQTDTSYLLELVYSNFQIEDDPTLAMKNDVFGELKIKYTTDEMGTFDSIVNKQELSDYAKGSLEKILVNSNLDTEKNSQAKEILEVMYSIENIEALFIEDIVMIHNYYGYGFELNDPTEFDVVYPSIGNVEINGTLIVTLKSVDETRDVCKLYGVQRPNKDELNEYLSAMAVMFMVDDELSDFSITSEIKETYDMQLSTGRMNKITFKQSTNVNVDGEEIKTRKTVTLKLQ